MILKKMKYANSSWARVILIFEKYFLGPDILYVRSFGSKVKTSMQNFVWWAHETLLARTAHPLKSVVMKAVLDL